MSFPKYVCVLDFEATCDDIPKYKNEIIEFPSYMLKFNDKTNNYEVIGKFQEYCKPKGNKVLTKFCIELTGITQDKVDAGDDFPNVLKRYDKWLSDMSEGLVHEIMILTCGKWDMETMMTTECRTWNIECSNTYKKYINVKDVFSTHRKTPKFYGMKGMLDELGIELIGRHHSGIDDCFNIAQIFIKLVGDGYKHTDNMVTYVKPPILSKKEQRQLKGNIRKN